uniref:Family with sequence similarity 110 member D n=1 Tax=Leptobrachium leishanense TaxID=445787 RepID=A0A8C5M4Z9_9ANUR
MFPASPPVSPLLNKTSRGPSASDRLEADKARYVKTPQVIERRQNPAINAHFSHAMPQKSQLTDNSGLSPLEYTCTTSFSPVGQRRKIPQQCNEVLQNQSQCSSFTSNISKGLHQPDSTHGVCCTTPNPQEFLPYHQGNKAAPNSPETHPQYLRRVGVRRGYRPDSLIMYRQRREVSLTGKENDGETGLMFRLFQGTPLLKRSNQMPHNTTLSRDQRIPVSPRPLRSIKQHTPCKDTNAFSPTTEQTLSDEPTFEISTDAEHFFESCGLEGSLLNLLENYYKLTGDAPLGSLETITSVSGGMGETFIEDVKEEKTPVSVIERNARVIKWIYSCQKARATGNELEKQRPRESTV